MKTGAILFSFFLLFFFGSCTNSPEKDQQGPSRIVTRSVSLDEMAWDLAGPKRILALSSMADDPGVSNIAPWAELVSRRSTGDLEALAALDGDLYLMPDWSSGELIQGLKDLGLEVHIIPTPQNLEEIFTTLVQVIDLIGPSPESALLQEEIQNRLSALGQRMIEQYEKPVPTLLEWTPDGRSGGPRSLPGQLIARAGGKHALEDDQGDQWGWVSVDRETLVKRDPDFLILPGWIWDEEQGPSLWKQEVIEDPLLQGLKALEEEQGEYPRLIVLPEALKGSSNHHFIRAMEVLYSRLYFDQEGWKPGKPFVVTEGWISE